jgi:beta-aspartyl-peptidase (threonine type)
MKISIVVHGGAKPFSPTIDKHREDYEKGLREAIAAGYKILEQGGRAVDAVCAAVMTLEDNEHFNAGKGSALNTDGKVEMDAAIMEGESRRFGAVTMTTIVKNPVSLAKAIMEKSSHIFLGGHGAEEYAKSVGLEILQENYFITEEQQGEFLEAQREQINQAHLHGTVGAVAADHEGNIAAAMSTGGTTYQHVGRVSDSCMIGAGCYANNETCAVSASGDGEFIMRGVVAYDIAATVEYRTKNIQEACDHVIFNRNAETDGDIGVIAVNSAGEIGVSFNSDCMLRGWKTGDEDIQVRIR